ncbi:hypothetical protein H8959_020959 [Pygathrix nigripes]
MVGVLPGNVSQHLDFGSSLEQPQGHWIIKKKSKRRHFTDTSASVFLGRANLSGIDQERDIQLQRL